MINGAYAGRYKLCVIGPNKTETEWFDNLITNRGLDVYGGTATNTFRAFLGAGVNEVSVTDIAMGAVASTTRFTRTVATQTINSPFWVRERHIFTFAVGAATGDIYEVGIGWGSETEYFTPLYSRALLPLPLTLTALDQVILTYDHYFCVSDYNTFTFQLNGTEVTGQCKPAGYFAGHADYNNGVALSFASPQLVYNFPDTCWFPYTWYTDAVLGQIHQFSVGVLSYTTTYSTDCVHMGESVHTDLSEYLLGSLTRQYTKTWFAEAGNFNNVNGVYIPLYHHTSGAALGFAIRFTPSFTKTELQKLTLTGEIRWNRTTVPE
jgi:hypothetical protein